MPPTATPSKVRSHSNLDHKRRFRDHCSCGDAINTEDLRQYIRWNIAHIHHRTLKAREHFRQRSHQTGLPRARR